MLNSFNNVPNSNIPVPPEKEGITIPRGARRRSSTSIYHVMSRGINKEAVFSENRERTRLLNLIRENSIKYDVEIYAYCIMPNHFHLLIKADLKELASFMAKIIAKFAKYYNKKHNRVGYVFQGRYKSQCVEDIGYFWNCLRYIHKNPLHLKEDGKIVDYKYSSMRELYYGEQDLLSDITFELVIAKFGTPEKFYEFHEKNDWNIFDDIQEEYQKNQLRIAKEILEQHKEIHKTEAIEIIDYNETNQELIKDIVSVLKVSVSEAVKIINSLKKEIIGTG